MNPFKHNISSSSDDVLKATYVEMTAGAKLRDIFLSFAEVYMLRFLTVVFFMLPGLFAVLSGYWIPGVICFVIGVALFPAVYRHETKNSSSREEIVYSLVNRDYADFYKLDYKFAKNLLRNMNISWDKSGWLFDKNLGKEKLFGQLVTGDRSAYLNNHEGLFLFTFPQPQLKHVVPQYFELALFADGLVKLRDGEEPHVLRVKHDLFVTLSAKYADTIPVGFAGMVLLSKNAEDAEILARDSITVDEFIKFTKMGIAAENFSAARELPEFFLTQLGSEVKLNWTEQQEFLQENHEAVMAQITEQMVQNRNYMNQTLQAMQKANAQKGTK